MQRCPVHRADGFTTSHLPSPWMGVDAPTAYSCPLPSRMLHHMTSFDAPLCITPAKGHLRVRLLLAALTHASCSFIPCRELPFPPAAMSYARVEAIILPPTALGCAGLLLHHWEQGTEIATGAIVTHATLGLLQRQGNVQQQTPKDHCSGTPTHPATPSHPAKAPSPGHRRSSPLLVASTPP